MKSLIPIKYVDDEKVIHENFESPQEYLIYETGDKQLTEFDFEKLTGKYETHSFLEILSLEKVKSILSFKMKMAGYMIFKKKGIKIFKPVNEELEENLSLLQEGLLDEFLESDALPFKSCSIDCSSCSTTCKN